MKFEIIVLGSSSALPTLSRNPSAQILKINERIILVDCGEGTQVQLRKHKIKYQRIDYIFITHLHGDHYFGLIGLLNTMQLLGRQKDLKIYAPEGLEKIMKLQMKYGGSYFNYSIEYTVISKNSAPLVLEDSIFSVTKIPLKHRVECYGYRFDEEPKPRKIIKEMVEKHGIPYSIIKDIKLGSDFTTKKGEIIKNKDLLLPGESTRSYAYCSDTSYKEDIIDVIKDVDLLYHESTFLNVELDRAKKTGHTTALQAGKIAQLANAKALLLGHYSVRYTDLEPFREEAMVNFKNVFLSDSGLVFNIDANNQTSLI